MRLIPVLLPSLATALVAPARPLAVSPARLAPLQAGAVADAEKLKVAPKLESPPVDSSGTLPKVNGGIVIGTRKLAVVTGASSGLGLYGALSLAKRGDYYVVLACRNVERAERVAKEMGFPANSYTVIKCELGSFKSVRDFVFNLRAFKGPRGLDALVWNAAVYLPADPKPRFTEDGYEMTMGVNHLSHFLLVQLLLRDLKKASDPRVIIVGSITGNSNTIGGGFVYPRAEIGELKGLKKGGGRSSEMVDGGKFDGAKEYKDAVISTASGPHPKCPRRPRSRSGRHRSQAIVCTRHASRCRSRPVRNETSLAPTAHPSRRLDDCGENHQHLNELKKLSASAVPASKAP